MNFEELKQKAEALGIEVDGRWKNKRLIKEISIAEGNLGSAVCDDEINEEIEILDSKNDYTEKVKSSRFWAVKNESKNKYIIGIYIFKAGEIQRLDKDCLDEFTIKRINRMIHLKKFSEQ